jgi:outer membrane protein TolC
MVGVQEDSLEQTRLAQTNGRATENDVLIAQISLDRQKEAILELDYSLKQSERALARLIGLDASLDATKLSEQLPEVAVGQSPAELFAQVASKNPDVIQSRLDVENARVQAIMGGQTYSPSLSMSLSVAPQYGYNRPDSNLFGNSFSQLFDTDNGAYTDVTFSVGMQVPVYNGGRSKKDKAALSAGVQIAEANLALKLRTLRDNLDSLFLKQHYLAMKVSLTTANLGLEERRLADKERLLRLSSATDLDVKSARASLAARQNDLWSAKVDEFLSSLDVLSLTGIDLGELIAKDGKP